MRLFNTLTQTKEEFFPFDEKSVKIYVCGITPYDTTHLGHAFTYVFFDVLYRYLKYKGFKVVYTQNVTDVNDRDKDILEKAKEQNIPWNKLADFWTKKFLSDMKTLNWLTPTNYLKASENISPVIGIIKELLKKKYAYQVGNNVYLNITKKEDYGKLSKLNKEQMIEKSKEFEEDIDNPQKKNPLDITLWRGSTPSKPIHIPSFDSPFGKGRPGWHIECSTMAIESLSDQIDIHGGGSDLIFPHHEAEIAQSEAATGKIPFAKYWIHTGMVMYKNGKMSKSKGNLVLVSDLLKKYSPNVIRFMLLSHHYRKYWEFEEQELDEAKKIVQKIIQTAQSEDYGSEEFEQLMDDDMNVPEVLDMLTQKPNKEQLNLLGFKI